MTLKKSLVAGTFLTLLLLGSSTNKAFAHGGQELAALPFPLSKEMIAGSGEELATAAVKDGQDDGGGNGKDAGQDAKPKRSFHGNVSWYGPGFDGKKTASGKIFHTTELTCAHRSLPFGTRILVENPKTGQTVIVIVTDRGPYAAHRVMDLTREAARRVGVLLGGVAYLECTVLNH